MSWNALRAAVLTVLMMAGCGDDGAKSPDAAVGGMVTMTTIGPAGGTLSAGGVTVTVPAGALSADTELGLRVGVESTVPLPSGLTPPTDPLIELLPHGQTFAVPVTITMPVTTPMPTHTSFYLADPADTTWEFFSPVTVSGTTATLETTHFCTVAMPCSAEVCDDQVDNDGDGLDNCADPDCRGRAGCVFADSETNCSNRIDDDGDNLLDCADSDCASSCGTLNINWEVRLNGSRTDASSQPYTCFAVGGDVIPYTIDGPGPSDITASVACSSADGTGTISVGLVPAGSHTINLKLRNSNSQMDIATAGPVVATVTAGQTTTVPSQALNVVPSVAPIQVSRIYVNGGDSALAYNHDFVELHNRSNTAVAMTNYSLQVLEMSMGAWHVTDLTGLTIPANGFLLIGYAQSAAQGVAITADRQATNPPQLDSISTAVALVNGTTAITSGQCPSTTVDLFGTLGLGAGCYEGTGLMTGSLNDNQALSRTNCGDTNNNSADFTVQTISAPRNSSSSPVVCP